MNCYLYARKSTESEDRQILSIEAQIKELKAVALNQGLSIVEVFSEAKSAKAPGRPIFNKMMEKVFADSLTGILCWKLDRLARNPVDGGNIIWAVEQNKLPRIIIPGREFRNSGDDKFWMQLEFGIAKKYVDDLSDNVKRGNRAKLEKGVLPGKAPLGYKNDKENKTIVKDPERFYLVRRIWDIILSGNYNSKELLVVSEKEWGLTIPQSKKRGGTPLTCSGLYNLLSNPFYYGAIRRKSEIYAGIHEPMISKAEFDRVQRILGRPRNCKKVKGFAYTGMIKCGECGSMVTAEEKVNRYGHLYTYYHCTKHKGGARNQCSQSYIRLEELERQISLFLEKIHLPECVSKWALQEMILSRGEQKKLQFEVRKSLDRALADCTRKLDGLLHLKLKELLSDEEYVSGKSKLTAKKIDIEREISGIENNPQIWFEPFQRLLSFLSLANDCFEKGDMGIKRQILAALSSNLLLKDEVLLIEAKKPFQLIVEKGQSPLGWGLVDDVRTFFSDPQNHFHIPVLEKTQKALHR